MVLSEVEETVIIVEFDEETYKEIYKQTKRSILMFSVREDDVILVSPPLRARS